jgi:glycine cleavage system aminomethyltransferase T
VGTDPDKAPAPQVETPVTPPSPAVLQAVTAAQTKLEAVTAALEGTKVRFVDCGQNASCSARLEASSLTGLRDLLQSLSAQQGGIAFVAREQLDAYAGRTFVADVTLGGAETRPVPSDENALLAN